MRAALVCAGPALLLALLSVYHGRQCDGRDVLSLAVTSVANIPDLTGRVGSIFVGAGFLDAGAATGWPWAA